MSATAPLLTVDLGNTSCGLRLGAGDDARHLPSLDPRKSSFADELAEALEPVDRTGRAVYSSRQLIANTKKATASVSTTW